MAMSLPLLLAMSRAACAATSSIDLAADHVAYYSNRFVVAADGHVRARLSDGTLVRGQTFAMDLKLNRFIVAGDVSVDKGADIHLSGAAFSQFIDFDRTYFIPIGEEPDRWTYIGTDYANPLRGREMPEDAFSLPDLGTARPFIIARAARILPLEDVQFTPAQVAAGPAYLPFPSYNLNFSPNPNFKQNAFAGAYIDVPIPLAGNRTSLTSTHVRYDGLNKLYLSFDQHFVWNRDYIVLSLNPATRPTKQYNLLANKRISPAIELRDFSQILNIQSGFSQPTASAQFSDVQLTTALHRSFVRVNADFYNNELIGKPAYTLQAEHPSNVTLSWTGFENRVAHTPLLFTLQSGLTFANDAYGIGVSAVPAGQTAGFAGTLYKTLYGKFAQLQLYTPSQQVVRNIFINATYIKRRQYFSLPHYFDTTQTGLSLSYLPPRTKVAYLASYTISNVGDYAGAQQNALYPSTTIVGPQDGILYSGFGAFRGFATTRSLIASFLYTPSPAFVLTLTGRKNKDFPQPIPGYYGVSPYQISANFRVRLAPQLLLDVSRSYYFSFGTLRWSPQFGIQFAP